jgi:hypothetical protein
MVAIVVHEPDTMPTASRMTSVIDTLPKREITVMSSPISTIIGMADMSGWG